MKKIFRPILSCGYKCPNALPAPVEHAIECILEVHAPRKKPISVFDTAEQDRRFLEWRKGAYFRHGMAISYYRKYDRMMALYLFIGIMGVPLYVMLIAWLSSLQ